MTGYLQAALSELEKRNDPNETRSSGPRFLALKKACVNFQAYFHGAVQIYRFPARIFASNARQG
jgi:hypothetical protein